MELSNYLQGASSVLDPSPSPEQPDSVFPCSTSIPTSSNSDLFELHRTPSLVEPDTSRRLSPSKNKLSRSASSLASNSLVSDYGGPHGPRLRDPGLGIVRRHSKSDYDIRRCSSIISGKLKSPAFNIRRLSVNGLIFNRFRSIYTIIMCCLSEILLVASLDVLLYLLTVTDNMPVEIQFHTVHVLIMHILLTPILYSYGFAPLKKRIKRALKLNTEPNQGGNVNEPTPSVF